jgi:hypothetical protein
VDDAVLALAEVVLRRGRVAPRPPDEQPPVTHAPTQTVTEGVPSLRRRTR